MASKAFTATPGLAVVPADRPTCRTCPYFHPVPHSVSCDGQCRVATDYREHYAADWCGQHPDMPAWIAGRPDRPGLVTKTAD